MDATSKQFYQTNGYIIVKNIVPLDAINDLYQIVLNVLRKFCPDITDFRQQEPWKDPLFHKAMLQFRSQHPAEFGCLFDTVQTSTALWRLGTDKRLCDVAAELMNDSDDGLSLTDLLLRMDAPNDKRNKLEWHQDSSYFRQNEKGENGCVCSITMRDNTLDNGPLEILPGSQTLGRIDVPSTGKTDALTSEQFFIPLDLTTSFTAERAVLNAGDAIFFNFDLIHRSGANVSEFFRFTAIARYHRMLTDDFKAGRLVYRARPVFA